jgi:MoaA/NifB/PqqE/SkfB family radical SAM enzyme
LLHVDVEQNYFRVGQAAEIGYNAISMQGGEPFMYQSLKELMRFSKSAGYYNSIISNGMLLFSSLAIFIRAKSCKP